MGRLLLAAVLCFALVPAPASEAQPSLEASAIEVSQVDHPKTDVRWGRAAAVIDAPLDKTLGAVEDYGDYAKFLPHFHESKVLSRRGTAALVYFEASVAAGAITFWSEMRVGPRKHMNDMEVIHAQMIKGNPRLMEARWDVRPVDAHHTYVAFQLLVVPKMPLPSGFVSDENASAAMKVIRALRKHLET